MPSTSQQQDSATFTLSIGGVDFCLAPSTPPHHAPSFSNWDVPPPSPIMTISKVGNDEAVIDLNGFVGSLRVVTKKHANSTSKTMWDFLNKGTTAPSAMTTPSDVNALPLLATTTTTSNGNVEDLLTYDNGNMADMLQMEDTSSRIVEDTPSPTKKGNDDEMMTTTGVKKEKKTKGQQKLCFFDRKGKKNSNKQQGSTNNNKRLGESKIDVADKKKLRVNNVSTDEDVVLPSTSDNDVSAASNDFIEEQLEDNSVDNYDMGQSLESLGQTMPDNDDESSMEDSNKMKSIHTTSSVVAMKSNMSGMTTTTPSTVAPCPRWGQTMTMIDHRRFIIYGGQTIMEQHGSSSAAPLADLFVYDLMDGSWSRPINCDGVARTWHTANFLPERQLLLCFGGEVMNEASGKLTTTDQVMVLDTDIMLWYPPSVSGQIPSGRSGHSSCVISNTSELVVFGGVRNGKWLNSVAVLDTNRWKWSTLKALGDAPRPRSYHSATVIGSSSNNGSSSSGSGGSSSGSRIVIFGGNDGDQCFNSVHVLEATMPGEGKKWIWSNPKCTGNAPLPRTGHVATLSNDGTTIMIYGGWDPNTEVENGDDMMFGDSYLLDTKTWSWRTGPKPRYEGASSSTNGGPERVGHSAVLAPGGKHGVQVLVFGGRVQGGTFVGDFQSLSV